MKQITILITDDHTLIRQSWSFIISADPRFKVIGEASNAEDALELAKQFRPDVALMDINLPGMNGLEATKMLKTVSPDTKVLGVSMHTQPAYAKMMMKQGAKGYLTKNSSRRELYRAILDIHEGHTYICDEVKGLLVDEMMREDSDKPTSNLSQKEIEVISFVKTGLSSKEIAGLLGLSTKTIEAHRYNILKKMQLKNTAALINHFNIHPIAI